jgi:hypothetical protein
MLFPQHPRFTTCSVQFLGKRSVCRLHSVQTVHFGNHATKNSAIGAKSGNRCGRNLNWRESRRQIVAR